jgi:hypothetical protein
VQLSGDWCSPLGLCANSSSLTSSACWSCRSSSALSWCWESSSSSSISSMISMISSISASSHSASCSRRTSCSSTASSRISVTLVPSSMLLSLEAGAHARRPSKPCGPWTRSCSWASLASASTEGSDHRVSGAMWQGRAREGSWWDCAGLVKVRARRQGPESGRAGKLEGSALLVRAMWLRGEVYRCAAWNTFCDVSAPRTFSLP